MDKLGISAVLASLIKQYADSADDADRDSRLLVPGLTRNIARQVHQCLLEQDVNSYLVIGEDEEPSESDRLISAVGLTSKRIGSFVSIASPGQLGQIHDSVRGSGGTIRSLAFSEEWPWIDDGSEPFRFDGPVLSALVGTWTGEAEEQGWMREFILSALLEHTRSSSKRAEILLDDILGSFDPDLYPEIQDIREKLIYHAGVPRPSGDLSNVARLNQDTARLCRRIVDRCHKEEDVRSQARDMVLDVVKEEEQENVLFSLDRLLDGIGRSSALDLGILAFYGCWGADKNDTSHWRLLDAQRLAELFGVRDREASKITYRVSCERGVTSDEGGKLVTFVKERIRLDVSYRVPVDQFSPNTWSVRVLNRQRVVKEQALTESEGNVHLEFVAESSTNNYLRKIPLRIAVVSSNDVEAFVRLDLHLCGEDRPALVMVDPVFEVIDAESANEEESTDKKLIVDQPIHLFLFSHAERDVTLCNENDELFDLFEEDGIWRSAQRTDVSAEPSGLVTRICRFGASTAVLCFETRDLEKGEFTLEDEYRVAIAHARITKVKKLTSVFQGECDEPYAALGRMDEAARRRIFLAKLVTSQKGWRPVLANLLEASYQSSKSFGDYVNSVGRVDGESFQTLAFPESALSLLRRYSESRHAILREVQSTHSDTSTSIEHPMYASHPIFVYERCQQMETLLKNFLGSYGRILGYLKDNHGDLEWNQIFVLSHLDCVVQWDTGRMRNAFFLLGPWHPLVLASRFMVQAALFSRARLLHDDEGTVFRSLSFLLGSVQGFKWTLGISANDRSIEPAYVTASSDPGWHFALKTNALDLAAREGVGDFSTLVELIRRNLGLSLEVGTGGDNNLAVTCLSNYQRAYPSRRSIGVLIRHGYTGSEVVRTVDNLIHAEEGPTEYGQQLPGGVRLYFEEPVEKSGNARWTNPPLYVYQYDDDAQCLLEAHPDIYMLPPANEISFKTGTKEYELPRGRGREVVFSEQLSWLTEGQTQVPKSITYEFDVAREGPEDIEGAFVDVTGGISSILGNPVATVCDVDLPQRLNAPWVVIPGQSIDPAILVKYVRDGADRAIQERALWDYKLDVTGRGNSFFVLSTIPKGFQVAVNGFFSRDHITSDFIVELGRIGIAIGGEALRSGRHALGVIGLIGTVRLMVGTTTDGHAPLPCSKKAVGFLVPVDSFSSFFGKSDTGVDKRTDLLAIHLVLPDQRSSKLRISACGLESKLVSGTFGMAKAHAALAQARTTGDEFERLVVSSLREGAMPERLALLKILKFGLRITSPSTPREIEEWIDRERLIYEAVLAGNYEYSDANYAAVLVSTEGKLPGAAEHAVLTEGLWVRLTKTHWPGIAETSQIEKIRNVLCSLFDTPRDSRPEDSEPTEPPPTPEDGEGDNAGESSLDVEDATPESSVESPPKQDISQEAEAVPEERGATLERIFVGVDGSRTAVYFDPQSPVDPLDNLNVMVTGSSGKGKTQFLKYLICKLREQDKNVLILDMKNDFAADSSFCQQARLDSIFIAFDGLPLNPLIPYPVRHPGTGDVYVPCGQYIAGVTSVLKITYGLGQQQQIAVKNAIVAAFDAAGISTSGSTPFTEDLRFPDFSAVGDTLEHDNPSAYNRLDPLFTLDLFRNKFRDQSFHGLVNRSAVLDLSQIQSEEIKNTLAQLIVLTSHAYYNTQPHSGTIRQFLVFDEGHRVLNSDYMLQLVRECRAYGVGTILSSQYPSDFPHNISASMASKIIHGNDRDADKVRRIVQLLGCEGQEGDVANLGRFQAFIDNRHHPHTLMRTLNYPLYLIWAKLRELGNADRAELSQADGFDPTKLPIANLVRQLEQMGLAEERDGRVYLL